MAYLRIKKKSYICNYGIFPQHKIKHELNYEIQNKP